MISALQWDTTSDYSFSDNGIMKSFLRSILVSVVLMSLAPLSWAQFIGVANFRGLAFGSFIVGNVGGSVTVNGDGSRDTNNMVGTAISSVNAAQFTVSGMPNALYNIELPLDNDSSASLTGPGVAMRLTEFTYATEAGSAQQGQLNLGGTEILSVGATLNVNPAQASGNYNGWFTVIVEYN